MADHLLRHGRFPGSARSAGTPSSSQDVPPAVPQPLLPLLGPQRTHSIFLLRAPAASLPSR